MSYDQYYTVAIDAVLLYDFLLTLGDEVNHVIGVVSNLAYCPHGRSNTLGMGGNHGVRRERQLSCSIR